jgi:hypothetical protein
LKKTGWIPARALAGEKSETKTRGGRMNRARWLRNYRYVSLRRQDTPGASRKRPAIYVDKRTGKSKDIVIAISEAFNLIPSEQEPGQ